MKATRHQKKREGGEERSGRGGARERRGRNGGVGSGLWGRMMRGGEEGVDGHGGEGG